ncbi:hypothetical protein L1887_40588 [Cichorium endivia]|nr:hypothetical protein L1887_40588 [Cichorium endivia]
MTMVDSASMIEERGVGTVVNGNQWTLLETKDVFQLILGGVLEKLIHLFHSGGSLDLEDTVGQRSVGQRHAYGDDHSGGHVAPGKISAIAVAEPVAGRNQAHAGSTCTAQILVWLIENALGVSQVVDGSDRAVTNAQLLVDHFHHGCQTVGGARSGGDDVMFRRVEQLMVRMGDCITGRIVDLYELKLWPVPGCSQSEATDPTETIDANFNSHVVVKPLDAEQLAFLGQQVDFVLKQLLGGHQRQQRRCTCVLEGLQRLEGLGALRAWARGEDQLTIELCQRQYGIWVLLHGEKSSDGALIDTFHEFFC